MKSLNVTDLDKDALVFEKRHQTHTKVKPTIALKKLPETAYSGKDYAGFASLFHE